MFEVRWERGLHQLGTGSGFAFGEDEGVVVVHERGTRLVGLDARDGAVRWDVAVGTWPRAVAVSGGRCLVIAQSTDRLSCLDVLTGELLWDVQLPPFTGYVVPVPGSGAVLVGGWRGYTPLTAFDLGTGALLWRSAGRVDTVRPATVGGGSGEVLIGAPGGLVVESIGVLDGRRMRSWRLPGPLAKTDHRAAFTRVGGGRFAVLCGEREVVCVPEGGDARVLAALDGGLVSSAAEFTGGLLWVRVPRGGYAALDPGDGGRVAARVDVGQPLVGDVVSVGAGYVIAGRGGVLYGVDAGGRVVGRVAVARRIAGLRGAGEPGLFVIAKGALICGDWAS